MKATRILLLILAVFIVRNAVAQTCTQLGQNPGTAFPVCGTSVFTQSQVKICGDRQVPSPCNTVLITDKNPYWYKFKCYTSGSLGFIITPTNLQDDYDWQLFDVTNEIPTSVYTKTSLFVACNWSGEVGITGASNAGNSVSVCEGLGKPLWSSMPDLVAGHDYLLLISHFTDSQSGYTLGFSGGTADITDPTIPSMSLATGICTGNEIRIKLNKQMKCASIAADGTDFSVSSWPAVVTTAQSVTCSDAFTTDSIVLTLNQPLPAGDYTVNVKKGSDGNSLLDNCDNNMPDGSAEFTVHENVSADFTYILKEGCQQDTVNFFHDGANHTTSWNWDLDGAASSTQNPSVIFNVPGDKNITLTVANDYCSTASTSVINIAPRIDAAFNSPEITCAVDNVVITNISQGNITSWKWEFGDGSTVTQKDPDPFKYQAQPGEKTYKIKLSVSNPIGCTDTASANIIVVGNCNIVVPTAFTPNNDGKNDYLYPTNAFGADNLVFRVYNRFGQIVFETKDWQRKWDGNVNGQPQTSGTYVWSLVYTLRSTGRKYNFKGTTLLVR
ncbi:MAG TPA: PKD domain-containing protein [Flavitalea sp.]|nr:PKD domain-containing protein [Flavitalea sp.]